MISSVPADSSFGGIYKRDFVRLKKAGILSTHFPGVIPNPTPNCVTKCANILKTFSADVVLGIGDGSNMDMAKAISA